MEKILNRSLEQLENGTPRDKVIRLKSVFKANKVTIQPVPDGMGWYKGVKRLSEADKKELQYWAEKDSSVVIKDGTKFDLNKPSDRVTWEWVKHSSAIADTEEQCQLSDVAEFYIYVEEEEANEEVKSMEKELKAMTYINEDSTSNYVQRAALLGVDMDGASSLVLKQYLYTIAKSSPDKIIRIYEAKDISLRLLLLKAIKNNIVSVDSSGMYRYGNNILGMSEDTTVAWMLDTDHKDIVMLMDREVNPDYYATKELEEKAKTDINAAAEQARKEITQQKASIKQTITPKSNTLKNKK